MHSSTRPSLESAKAPAPDARVSTVSRRALCVAMAAALPMALVAGCSSGSGSEEAQGATRTATIGVIAPMSGLDSARGKGVLHAVELAAAQANESGAVPGWRLAVVGVDDKGEDAGAVEGARKLAADGSVVAVVGSVFSGATGAAAPEFAKAGLAQVAPTATDSSLTRGAAFASKPRRQYPTFFRVCPPDDDYAPALADFLAGKKVRSVAAVDDGSDYGKGFNAAFAATFSKLGGSVVEAGAVDPETGENAAAVAKVKAARPQAVVFGGIDADGAPLSLALKRAGVMVPVAGGDGLYTPDYLTSSGIQSAGDLSMLAGRPPETTEAGRAFVAAYRAKRFDTPVALESPLAYDAATAIIAALRTSLPNATGEANTARKATVEALASVKTDGIGGPISFDQYGEPSNKTLTIYRVSGGDWAVEKTLGAN